MSTAQCYGFHHIPTGEPGLFAFAALDYTGPHAKYFDDDIADFLHYAVGRDRVTDFLCVCSPPGIPVAGGPVPISPPATILQIPRLWTHLVDPGRRGTFMLSYGERLVPIWVVGSRIRVVANSVTGEGDVYLPLAKNVPITVELDVSQPKIRCAVSEYQVASTCTAAV